MNDHVCREWLKREYEHTAVFLRIPPVPKQLNDAFDGLRILCSQRGHPEEIHRFGQQLWVAYQRRGSMGLIGVDSLMQMGMEEEGDEKR